MVGMHSIRFLTIFAILGVFALLLAGCTEPQSSNVDVFFCPQDQCEDRAVAAIGAAQTSVDVAMYSFTSKELFSELEKASARGVRVRVVADYTQSAGQSSVVPWLDGNGIPARVYTKSITMHDKFAVIDNKIVLTGSYNWTTNGDERNRENLAIITDSAIAEQYSEEFFRLWAEAD